MKLEQDSQIVEDINISMLNTLMCIGPGSDPFQDGLQATNLDGDEVVRLLDACIRHHDHFNGFKVATMVLLGTLMGKW